MNNQIDIGKLLLKDAATFSFMILSIFGIILGPFVLIFWGLFIYRIYTVYTTIKEGLTTTAIITDIRYRRNIWRIYFSYKINDVLYNGKNTINSFTKPAYAISSDVQISYLENKPQKAIITELYTVKNQ
ncbi:hypothetical protein JW887_01810 [Candidatus Dojkabacteria bacterium]|nr:hypothetical protein [Candidatus Dojkabacteria bacterium]